MFKANITVLDSKVSDDVVMHAMNDAKFYHGKLWPLVQHLNVDYKAGNYNHDLAAPAYLELLFSPSFQIGFHKSWGGRLGNLSAATLYVAACKLAAQYQSEVEE